MDKKSFENHLERLNDKRGGLFTFNPTTNRTKFVEAVLEEVKENQLNILILLFHKRLTKQFVVSVAEQIQEALKESGDDIPNDIAIQVKTNLTPKTMGRILQKARPHPEVGYIRYKPL